ncbi:hypothetical protein E2C01_101880 [Portunus trituberculatus]|uniref:Uncharacterized protein n=1 Tax=Portunus trituberculatus TaxID=210409 RepID=A0A5B7KBR6_PORTR|nr:hypothetical protein [Portunus trituberculatus]
MTDSIVRPITKYLRLLPSPGRCEGPPIVSPPYLFPSLNVLPTLRSLVKSSSFSSSSSSVMEVRIDVQTPSLLDNELLLCPLCIATG